MLWFFIILILMIISALIIMRAPVFGGCPTSKDREEYAKRAEGYFDGKHFNYPSEWELEGVLANNRVSKKGTFPKDRLPVETPDLLKTTEDNVTVTWFGHSFLLIQMHGKNLLVDPVYSKRSSPVQWAGPARFNEPGITIDDLPDIDAVLITHDHYDHLDMDTVKSLEDKTSRYIVPLGVEKHITRWINDDSKVINLAWWESYDLDGLEIYCTPANHKSGRALDNQQSTLFCSWILKDKYHQIFVSGDSGYGAHYGEIYNRYGDFNLFICECGQYNINWHYWHMFPEEGALAAETLHAKTVMPIHWGSFVLSNHGWDDSPERITKACEEKGIEVITPKLCETMSLNNSADFHERWWRSFK